MELGNNVGKQLPSLFLQMLMQIEKDTQGLASMWQKSFYREWVGPLRTHHHPFPVSSSQSWNCTKSCTCTLIHTHTITHTTSLKLKVFTGTKSHTCIWWHLFFRGMNMHLYPHSITVPISNTCVHSQCLFTYTTCVYSIKQVTNDRPNLTSTKVQLGKPVALQTYLQDLSDWVNLVTSKQSLTWVTTLTSCFPDALYNCQQEENGTQPMCHPWSLGTP